MSFAIELVRRAVVPLLDPRPEAVLLGGSHAEGNANASSDVDVIAILSSRRGPSELRRYGLEVEGNVVGVTSLTVESLRAGLEDLDQTYRSGAYPTDDLATRLAEAVAVYDPDGTGQALIEEARRFVPTPETYEELVKASLSFYQDALGSLSTGDAETAILAARQAATIAVDIYLLKDGARSLKPKWHLRRLRARPAHNILARYRRVLALERTDKKKALRVIADMDGLLCEVLGIDSLKEFGNSALTSRRTKPSEELLQT
jgi:hypothetical protein